MALRLNGATSGYVEIDAPATAGSNTLTLPNGNGTSGQVLSTDGAGALSWVQGGRILQVVNATYGTEVTNSTSTFADTGLTATITPTSATSKILVLVSQVGCLKNINNTYLELRLLAAGSEIIRFERAGGYDGGTTTNNVGSCSTSYLHSPATTSAVIYKTQFASGNNSAVVAVQHSVGGVSGNSTITLLEVAA